MAEFDPISYSKANKVAAQMAEMLNDVAAKKVARFVIGTSTAYWTAKDCDYLCDGTNDQEEINNAIAALLASGGEIVILDGTYNITASINISKNNVSLRGNGNATVLKRMWNSSSPEGVITLTSATGCRVENLQIDGNKIEHTAVNNCGIYLSSSSNNTIIGNTCNDNNSNGIFLSSSSNDNTITSNTCDNNNSNGIYLSSSSDNTIIGNTCNNNSTDGIYLSSSNYNTITGNTCTNNSTGIELFSSSETTITGNTCNNNDYSGILLYSSSNNTITGNTCTYNNHGIGLNESGNNNTVTGNTCNNNSAGGILLYSSSNNMVTGNTCIRGTGTPGNYTTDQDQYTILLSGTDNNYNLISFNNCMGKEVEVGGGRGNSVWGNKFNDTSDLPWAEIRNVFPVFGEGDEPGLAEGD